MRGPGLVLRRRRRPRGAAQQGGEVSEQHVAADGKELVSQLGGLCLCACRVRVCAQFLRACVASYEVRVHTSEQGFSAWGSRSRALPEFDCLGF